MDDPSPSSLVLKLVILAVLILVNAFFAMSEIAVITLNDNKIRKLAEGGHQKARKIIKLTSDSTGFLSTIQTGITLAGFLTSASASASFEALLSGTLQGWFGVENNPVAKSAVSAASVFIITVIISFFSIVLGELLPKRIAMHNADKISFSIAGPLLFLKAAFRPFVALLTVSTNGILRLFGIDPTVNEDEVTEEEIRMLVDVGEEKGVIEESQKDMINNIFEFDDTAVADVMTHRTSVVACEAEDSIKTVMEETLAEGYSRIPVFEEDLDNIVGILYVKDLLKYVGKSVPTGLKARDIMRTAHFVPDSKTCGNLFTEMTENKIHLSVVVDEYGGTAGIVTIEDLLESIVGNIQDEFDDENDDIQQLDDQTFTMDGSIFIEEVEERLNTKLPEGEYDTLGGMIMAQLGRIPEKDEHPSVECGGYLFTVESLEDRRIERVLAEKMEEAPEQVTSG
ncbi:MAG: hemolysin family protein [Oscillospiraceae bacterium]|jgi:putative hemolysin|nr:hemolysin family protein [Oscillospiraceae bacterium]